MTDGSADNLVECSVAAAGVESCLMVGMIVAPLAYPTGGIAGALGYVQLVVEIGVQSGVGLHLLGDGGCGVLFACTGVYDK